jgi:hypothetical protein
MPGSSHPPREFASRKRGRIEEQQFFAERMMRLQFIDHKTAMALSALAAVFAVLAVALFAKTDLAGQAFHLAH